MTRSLFTVLAVACCSVMLDVQPARAQQTVNLSIGRFMVRGADARVDGDVLNADRDFLTFDVDEFNTWSIGGEWLFPVGNYIEAARASHLRGRRCRRSTRIW